MFVKEQKRQRVLALDILKFLAVFFVINSHSDSLYPTDYRALATGGTIGDGLFLFCSGYALFLGQKRSFSDYFKRRIQRIWPSLFVSVVVLALLYHFRVHLVDFIGRSFIRALFVYYILIYFINRYLSKQLKPLMISLAVVSVVAYAILYPQLVVKRGVHPEVAMYYFKWMPYFFPARMSHFALRINAHVPLPQKPQVKIPITIKILVRSALPGRTEHQSQPPTRRGHIG